MVEGMGGERRDSLYYRDALESFFLCHETSKELNPQDPIGKGLLGALGNSLLRGVNLENSEICAVARPGSGLGPVPEQLWGNLFLSTHNS